MSQLNKLVILTMLILGIWGGNCKAQETNYRSFSLYVYNFMKYIEWPEEESIGDFVIGFVGDSKIKEELIVLANHKKLKGRKIVFKLFDKAEDITNCHLLYVSSSKSSSIKSINQKFAGKPMLIVGEREESVYKGAALSFLTTDEDELKFDINKKEIESHKLKISSSLIKLGAVIN